MLQAEELRDSPEDWSFARPISTSETLLMLLVNIAERLTQGYTAAVMLQI